MPTRASPRNLGTRLTSTSSTLSACDDYGLEKQMRSTTDIVRTHIPAIENAHAYHDWDGKIRLSEGTADGLARHGNIAVSERHGSQQSNLTRRGHDDHMRVAVHEVLHGYGPVYPHQYVGKGAKVEEITTEVAARRIMNDRYGASKRAGSYNEYIDRALEIIKVHKGTGFDEAVVELDRVSFAFKKERRGAGHPVDLFVKHLGPGRLTPAQIENAL
jgi:hypothetical protein